LINIVKASTGCSCTVGYPGYNKLGTMKLSTTCDVQSITHEIGHAVGLIHEHQRPKRDQYLTIPSNLYSKIEAQFGSSLANNVKANLAKDLVYSDQLPYDYTSVMHYGSWPRNHQPLRDYLMGINLPLFTKKTGVAVTRPTFGLTLDDIKKVNLAYPD